ATDVTSVAQTDFMSAGPTDTLEQRHNVSVGAADVTLVCTLGNFSPARPANQGHKLRRAARGRPEPAR
ncbi:hypothetical protein PCASD_15963, partial [Puccinia coronata f. sp. avenae]